MQGCRVHEAPSPAQVVAEVNAHLVAVLERERAAWARIDPWFAEPVDLLSDFVLAGGKRLRPLFCRYGFLAAGGDPEHGSWLDVATGLELLHAFALLHDDVMDGSDHRRGRPSMHCRLHNVHQRAGWHGDARRFGEGVAVLIGDLAFACADRLMRTSGCGVGRVWDELRVELMMGQYMDVVGASREPLGIERALRVARYKSGAYTVERPLLLGAAHAEGSPDVSAALGAFGRPLGEAFQLRDDLLGVFGDETATGKPVGDDLRAGKPTVLLALARQLARSDEATPLARVGAADLRDEEIAEIRYLLIECGARDAVVRMIADRYADAVAILDAAMVPDSIREHLRQLAGAAVWRAA